MLVSLSQLMSLEEVSVVPSHVLYQEVSLTPGLFAWGVLFQLLCFLLTGILEKRKEFGLKWVLF